MTKYVYSFGEGKADGNREMKNLLGGKGAGLAEMTNLGIPVPAGFTITTEVCTHYYDHEQSYPSGLENEVKQALGQVEKAMGATFGDAQNPLLVSVRSGARTSMPGMMDTVLNLGLNTKTVEGLAARTGDERFAWDSFRRFVAMYGDVVLGLKPEKKEDEDPFEVILEAKKKEAGVEFDHQLTPADLKDLVKRFKQAIQDRLGIEFPEDPWQQLWGAIGAVFGSWNNRRAIDYRRIYHIPASWGTAVNVQAMVFGNMGDDCATGVAFTRNPATGDKKVFGEWLPNAQGEDVVAGIRTPRPLSNEQKAEGGADQPSLEEAMPELYKAFIGYAEKLEHHYADMQDLEFTIQRGKLYMLQTRSGKRTGFAGVKIATDLVSEGLVDEQTAVTMVEAEAMEHLLAPVFNRAELTKAENEGRHLATGLPGGPGAACGKVVFHADDAKLAGSRGDDVLLVRIETSPEDVGGMAVSRGILTSRGGMTSHAALVARQRGKPCVVGCGAIEIDYAKAQFKVGDTVIKAGDWISIDGTTGKVYKGEIEAQPSEVVEALIEKSCPLEDCPMAQSYQQILEWSDRFRRLGVRTNADTPGQSAQAVALGAEGIGLCRTEHMFFEEDRITAVRRMILSEDLAGREAALSKLLPMQRDDFHGIFKAMNGRPVTIRTLDPPLHEFLPHGKDEIGKLAKELGVDAEHLEAVVESLGESNPMLGHRGCRLGTAYPEITAMQARAILEAACDVAAEGIEVHPEIMIPLVSLRQELAGQREVVDRVAEEVFKEKGRRVDYLVGTMIELPRAAICADQIAEVADFFSFGTNDLTQTTFGISRDDAAKFLFLYIESGILPSDPFQSIDQNGVGELVRMGTTKGRATNPKLKVGICGEHGGDPKSIELCHDAGLDYVSCSPRRVPVARVAAAQAALAGAKSPEPVGAA
ncbi:MAG: pyruvate, phosphate dikinase [Candidatus Eiseniibacteriota bacterium]|jgi:pyruvate,orthophosphate dikinase